MDTVIHMAPNLHRIGPTVDDTNFEMMGGLVFGPGLGENVDT